MKSRQEEAQQEETPNREVYPEIQFMPPLELECTDKSEDLFEKMLQVLS